MNVTFKTKEATITAALSNSPTAQAIINKLPIQSTVQLWGDEIYFEIPVNIAGDALTVDVSVGDIAYWPSGNCLCIFFGRTPISTDDRPQPASPVSIVGKVTSSLADIKRIKTHQSITVTKGI